MPYFFILPVYLALLLGMIVVAAALRLAPRLRFASGYIFGGAVGSLAGFLLLNALVILCGVAPAWLQQVFQLPAWLQTVGKYFAVAMLLLGPFVGSAIGVIAGFAAGVVVVLVGKRRTA